MRRRRRLHRAHSRAAMKHDWLILGFTPCPVILGDVAPCGTEFAADSAYNAEIIQATDLVAKEDSMTIIRIVGEIVHLVGFDWGTTTTPVNACCMIHEAIVLGHTGSDGNDQYFDPRLEQSMEDDNILWRRMTVVSASSATPSGVAFRMLTATGAEPGLPPTSGSKLDIHVKRKMVAGDVLLYCAGASFSSMGSVDPATVNWHSILNVRGLVKF